MTASDDYVSSSSDYAASYNDPPPADEQYSINSKIMVAAIIVLFFVVFFISSLHIYGKWLWRRHQQRSGLHVQGGVGAEAAASYIRGGLDKAAIALLPTFVYKAVEAEKGSDPLECAVCLTEFQEDEKGRMLPSCKHSFHTECIDMWFYSHSTCPLCRAVVKPAECSASSSVQPLTQEQEQPGQVEGLRIQAQNETPATPATPTATEGTAVPNSTNVFIHGDQILIVGTPSPAISSRKASSPSTSRYAPHITIEIPTRQEYSIPSPAGCLSLSSRRSRGASPIDQACSTSAKSQGLRVSLTRMLSSKGKRVI